MCNSKGALSAIITSGLERTASAITRFLHQSAVAAERSYSWDRAVGYEPPNCAVKADELLEDQKAFPPPSA